MQLNHEQLCCAKGIATPKKSPIHDKKKVKGKGQKAKGKTSKEQQPDVEPDEQQLKLL
ncbi:hypothetical protein H6F89_33045 [Cyanobacteria bacterium FACHB-63]|nr:hypothetical protein [Cyanobacteria bacterium FACHB-63]